MIIRWNRLIGLLIGMLGVTLLFAPMSAPAQIRLEGINAANGEGKKQICRDEFGNIKILTNGDCGDGNFVSFDPDDLAFGPADNPTVFDYNGNATFNGTTTINGPFNLNGSINVQGITSTGITNNGMFTNNGSASVTGMLTAGSLTTSTASISGQANVGSLLSSGLISGGSFYSTGNSTIGGFLQVNNGASILGLTQLASVQVFQSLSIASGATVNMGGNRVQNVGAPIAATDAANKAYVDATAAKSGVTGQDTAAALGGGSTYDPGTGHISAPSYTVGTAAYSNVGAAIAAANTSGLKYFHTNSTLPDGAATGADSTAIGSAQASGAHAIAVGPGSTASGSSALAVGDGATASANGAVAIGQASAATGTNAIAIGTDARATGSVAVGTGALASNGGAAFGDRSQATGTNSAALGPDAVATAANATAIGSGSLADQANTVSVGTTANRRRITNVAAGTAASDAATLGQVAAAGSSVASALGGGSTARSDGTITAPSYALNGTTYNDVGSALGGVSTRIDGVINLAYDIRKEERRGIAAATAMANAPMPSEAGKTSWAFNTALFRGEAAVGGSIAHRFDTETPLAATAGFAYAPGGNTLVRVGMAGEF